MPTPTYTPLANITLGSAAASVTLSGISQLYRDLVLVVNGTPVNDYSKIRIQFNSDTGSNYSNVLMYGNGSGTSSNSATSTYIGNGVGNLRSTIASSIILNAMDYSAVDKHKSTLLRIDNTDSGTAAYASRWASTSAITSILLSPDSGNWAAGSTFALYGIAA